LARGIYVIFGQAVSRDIEIVSARAQFGSGSAEGSPYFTSN
jgi:hypothetical protein